MCGEGLYLRGVRVLYTVRSRAEEYMRVSSRVVSSRVDFYPRRREHPNMSCAFGGAGAPMSQLASLSANLEDGAETLLSKIRRPRCWLFSIAIVLVLLVAGDPLWAALLSDGYTVSVPHEAQRTMTAPPSDAHHDKAVFAP